MPEYVDKQDQGLGLVFKRLNDNYLRRFDAKLTVCQIMEKLDQENLSSKDRPYDKTR